MKKEINEKMDQLNEALERETDSHTRCTLTGFIQGLDWALNLIEGYL